MLRQGRFLIDYITYTYLRVHMLSNFVRAGKTINQQRASFCHKKDKFVYLKGDFFPEFPMFSPFTRSARTDTFFLPLPILGATNR